MYEHGSQDPRRSGTVAPGLRRPAMANPFPGMDPYLEGSIWQSVHANLATDVTRYLVPRLYPKYVALTTERFVLAGAKDCDDNQVPLPDVVIVTDQPRGA